MTTFQPSRAFALHAAIAASFGVALGGVAAAQPAPITYAGQGGAAPVSSAALTSTLAGGDENSYGYGAQRQQRRQGAVIDIRRASNAAQPQSQVQQGQAPAQPSQPAEQATRPEWLERERVGAPYEANGTWYVPTPEPGYQQTGMASWYGPTFHGQATASGETFDQEALTAAHPTLPIPSLVQVTNLENGREVIVRVNDRGPFVGERLIDMSRGAAEVLGFERAGQARVHVRYLGPAPRRVNANGAPAPLAAPPPPAPVYAPVRTAEGPVSLLPPAAAETYAEAAPLPPVQAAPPEPRYAPAPANGAYFVQVGAFSDLTNAHRVRAAVERAGPVEVDIRETSLGELFRVRVGPWNSREEADAARSTLAGLGYREAIVATR